MLTMLTSKRALLVFEGRLNQKKIRFPWPSSLSFFERSTSRTGNSQRHTGEIIVWKAFEQWQDTEHSHRSDSYQQFKQYLQEQILILFAWNFLAQEPLIIYTELSTPLSTEHFIQRSQSAIYG